MDDLIDMSEMDMEWTELVIMDLRQFMKDYYLSTDDVTYLLQFME